MFSKLKAWLKRKFGRKPEPQIPVREPRIEPLVYPGYHPIAPKIYPMQAEVHAPQYKAETKIRGQEITHVWLDEADTITGLGEILSWAPAPSSGSVYSPPGFEGEGGSFSGGGASDSWSDSSSDSSFGGSND